MPLVYCTKSVWNRVSIGHI